MVMYRDRDGVERARYEVARSRLMEEVMKDESKKVKEEHMTGLYALRQFEVAEPIAVYLGEDIGAYDGDGMVEMERRAARGGGRHVMRQGARLVDGKHGPTGAQYINSAYQAPAGWVNNARILATGTIVATTVIRPGTEILMAYGEEYWRRWGERERKPRGRPKRARGADVAGVAAARSTAAASVAVEADVEDAGMTARGVRGGGQGDGSAAMEASMTACVAPEGTPARAGRERGQGRGAGGSSGGGQGGRGGGRGRTRERRGAAAVMWSPLAHRAYERRFERGEGGGVT